MEDEKVIFRCFASGSSGNCYYLGTPTQGILIDAGISARAISKHLRGMRLDFSNILGVLVTHDHADHIRAVDAIGERMHVPIFATRAIHEGIGRNYGVKEKLRTSKRYFEKEEEWQLRDFTINTIQVSHDATECLSYIIDFRGQRFMIVTDCGEPNQMLEEYIATSNHLVIEANHDEQMLLNGPYPTYLKERILSPRGHQSNVMCGKLLQRNYHDKLYNIWLCHLGRENNDPEVAFGTVGQALLDVGVVPGKDVFLMPLERTTPSPTFVLEDTIITKEQIYHYDS
ncbi:MAG: MBL fold metallo-hydrolase [Paludibacteraceae bacterium]|nr:MBL fold metallo-hydrolase [Paludibacteraceae bacterium]